MYLEHANSSSRKTPAHFLQLAVTYASKKERKKERKTERKKERKKERRKKKEFST
jgi:hypothetical protein